MINQRVYKSSRFPEILCKFHEIFKDIYSSLNIHWQSLRLQRVNISGLGCKLKLRRSWNITIILFTQSSAATSAIITRNTLDCDQSNYSSRIVFSHIPIESGQTGISAIRSVDPENPTIEPNMKWIGRPLAEIWPFEISPNEKSVGRQYILLLTRILYTPLRYVRNVAREE